MSDAGVAQVLELSARLAPFGDAGTSPLVGQPFGLIIEARHAPGGLALLPETIELPKALAERRSERHHSRSLEGAVEVDRYQLQLIAFEPGELHIPELSMALGSTVAKTNALEIEIGTGFSDAELPVATSTRPEAIQALEQMAALDGPPLPVLVDDYTPAFVFGGVLASALIMFLAFRYWKASEAKVRPGPPPPPPRPAHELALEALAQLEARGHVPAGRMKLHFSELSELMRAWAGARYGFLSLELTVDELIDSLKNADRQGLDLPRLGQILALADMVKFAKLIPSADDGLRALTDARAIVIATQPKQAPPSPPPDGAPPEVRA